MSLVSKYSPAQARELALLVEMEAGWENLRVDAPRNAEQALSLKELQQKQKAYEVFHVKLVAYNKAHRPAHVAELLLNTPDRLNAWCRNMIALYRTLESDPQAPYPAQLVEKAHRWADRLADKLKLARVPRPTPERTIPAAIRELEELAQWCMAQIPAKLAG